MTPIEAIIYCLGFVSDKAEDGEYCSQVVYDANNETHWISWEAKKGKLATPRFCSGSFYPFSEFLGPYSVTRKS